MIEVDDIRLYLPKYLTEENYKKLISQLNDFPENINAEMFTSSLESDVIFQGDGIIDIPVIEICHIENGIKKTPCIIISNTCDMDLSNKRVFPTSIMYSPIVDMCKYIKVLEENNISEVKLRQHIEDIKSQKITNIFYIPAGVKNKESIVFLDKVLNMDVNYIDRHSLNKTRIFSLSDYGFYLFLFKLSIHFSRIQEKVNRGSY